MNQQPDKFFRDKLEAYQRPVPASAWERIAAAQHKKKHKGFWLKIAATLLLITTAAYLLWPSSDQPNKQIAQDNKEKVIAPTPGQAQQPLLPSHDDPQIVDKATDNKQQPQPKKRTVKNRRVPAPVAKQKVHDNPVASVKDSNTTDTVNEIVQSETVVAINEIQNSTVNDQTQHVTLVYTANEVSKYLDKKGLDEATSDEKKPSTLQKLLKKANDLKTNQDPFGELRQKKNEILALNFKNDKQRGQNK